MKQRKVLGLVLMLSSIVLCIVLVAAVVFYFHQRFMGLGEKFPNLTFHDYFWQVSKTNLVFAVLVGLLPNIPGLYLYCTD